MTIINCTFGKFCTDKRKMLNQTQNVPYERSNDTSNNGWWFNNCSRLAFTNKKSVLVATFLILFFLTIVSIMIYLSTLTDTQVTLPIPAPVQPALIEQALKKTPAFLNNSEGLFLSIGNASPKNRTKRHRRRKRQVRLNREVPVDCFSPQRLQECRLILNRITQLTSSFSEKIDIMKQDLVEKGVLTGRESQQALNTKILECLQCRSNDPKLIPQEKNRAHSPVVARSASDNFPDVLKMFEEEQPPASTASSITFIPGRRPPQSATTPPPSSIGQTTVFPTAYPSKPTQVKVSFDSPVTALPRTRDGTFGLTLQIDPRPPTGQGIYPDQAHCVAQPNQPQPGPIRQLSQSIPVPTFGENRAGLPPIIVPTAETTKTSQQFQFSPQMGWSSMPICFSYGPNNMIQLRQGFGVPSGPLQTSAANAQVNFAPQQAPLTPPILGPTIPQTQPAASQAVPQPNLQPSDTSVPQTPAVSNAGQSPYYCTYIPSPTFQFPAVPGTAEVPKAKLASSNQLDQPTTLPSPFLQMAKISCSANSLPCKDGSKCVTKHRWCDREVDCPDASDEIDCPCKNRIGMERICDGYPDCPNAEDEDGCFGCPKKSFNCEELDSVTRRPRCIDSSQRCDGLNQCLNGQDELNCNLLSPTAIMNLNIEPVGSIKGYQYRNWKGKWYPVCNPAPSWAQEACAAEIGVPPYVLEPLSKTVDLPTGTTLGTDIYIQQSGKTPVLVKCRPTMNFIRCPNIPCGTRLISRSEEVARKFQEIYVPSINVAAANNELVAGPRVVGGKPSDAGAWPFVVGIFRNGEFHCGGVILNELWILTALHCMGNVKDNYFEVHAGMLRRQSFAPYVQIAGVDYVISHPHYNPISMKNDIALIRLSSLLEFNRYVRPACLPDLNTQDPFWMHGTPPGTTCIAAGWGATNEGGRGPDNLHEVEVPILANCNHLRDMNDAVICAGYRQGGRDACQGDSGGPLMCKKPNSADTWYVAGLISHGEGCARPGEPGVYTKVSKFNAWIENTINQAQGPKNKNFSPHPVCRGFVCTSPYRKCIEEKRRCDGIIDCCQGEDELNCPNTARDNCDSKLQAANPSIPGTTFSPLSSYKSANPATMYPSILGSVRPSNPTTMYPDVPGLYKPSNPTTIIPIISGPYKPINPTTMYPNVPGLYKPINPTTMYPNVPGLYKPINPTTMYPNVPQAIGNTEYPSLMPEFPGKTDLPIPETTIAPIIPEIPATFICKRIIQNIPLEKVCNRVYDCEDATDEENCTCRDLVQKIYPSVICDGKVDCFDGSDEQGCSICQPNEYHCHRSGSCIPIQRRCDEQMDCRFNEDELDCFAFTDGIHINLDFDKRPLLHTDGIVTRYESGFWKPLCFKAPIAINKNDTALRVAGQKFCTYLGFRNAESAHQIPVQRVKLTEQSVSNILQSPTYPQHVSQFKRQINEQQACDGLYVKCKPTCDRKIGVLTRVDPRTNIRNFTWPWEALIFVDGRYHCSGVLLENNLLLSSDRCSNGIDLNVNYTTAVFGKSNPDIPICGPYQQSSQIVEIRPIKHSAATLYRLAIPVIMTRDVQPIYLDKKIFPPAVDDTCIAIGCNDRHQRIFQILRPDLEDCPICHRCYAEKDRPQICNPSRIPWSGTVVCLSAGGWYPAAVFDNKDDTCGFVTRQTLNGIDFIGPHLANAIDEEAAKIVQYPMCDGVRCAEGNCMPWNKVCDGIRDCLDGADESQQSCQVVNERCAQNSQDCRCAASELRCGSGKCVPKQTYCDDIVDCPDGTDEPSLCTCANYLQLTNPSLICDGRRNCWDKSDEDPSQCLCKDSSFKCNEGTNGTLICIAQDFVCDGEPDCPDGSDEFRENCRDIKGNLEDPQGAGYLVKRSYGIWHRECFDQPIQDAGHVNEICASFGYKGGVIKDIPKLETITFSLKEDFFMFNLNWKTWVTRRGNSPLGEWKKSDNCYSLSVRCF